MRNVIFSTIMITGLGFGFKDTGLGLGLEDYWPWSWPWPRTHPCYHAICTMLSADYAVERYLSVHSSVRPSRQYSVKTTIHVIMGALKAGVYENIAIFTLSWK